MLNNRFELDMVELVLPLSAVSEKSPSSTVEMTPSAKIDDGEKSREKIINIIRDNPTVTQLELSNMLKKSPKAIEKHIKNLREDGIIRRVGPDNGGYWEVLVRHTCRKQVILITTHEAKCRVGKGQTLLFSVAEVRYLVD